MQIKISPTFGLVIFLVITASVLGFKAGRAALPVEAGLDEKCSQPGGRIPAGCVDVDGNNQINEQDCGAPENSNCPLCQENIKCSQGLFCGELGKCVGCENDNQCNSQLLETCKNNICTTKGGNGVGGLCIENGVEGSNCFDDLKCVKHSCEEAGGGELASFGEACTPSFIQKTCKAGLDCDSTMKVCVECVQDVACNAQYTGERCQAGVCVKSGTSGNALGEPCVVDKSCTQNLACDQKTHKCIQGSAGGGESNWMGVDLSIQDVANIINGLACWLTRIATAIMVIFLILAGFRFMNARGDPTKWTAAKKNFRYVLTGILVIMAVYVIIATVAHAVGRTDFSLIPLVC